MASERYTTPTTNQETTPTASATTYEQTHVHSIYAAIAPHFSQTRHKPWPLVTSFLLSRPPGSIGLDLGCGNGKNLSVNPAVFIIGSDRSEALVSIAAGASKNEPHVAIVSDLLSLPHPEGKFDFAICIAVIHHLSSEERRVEGMRAVLATLKKSQAEGGWEGTEAEALIFVWAVEQQSSRRGWDRDSERDVLVPWVMKGTGTGKKKRGKEREKGEDRDGREEDEKDEEKTFQRYYHLSEEGELEGLVKKAGGVVVRSGYERDNWWVVARRGMESEC
jgi:tRNA (uracil-5-)-methyltransferase TRM9